MSNFETVILETPPTILTLPGICNEGTTDHVEASPDKVWDALIAKMTDSPLANFQDVAAQLEQLEGQRKAWEGNELAASHARLYFILTECYAFYLAMKSASTDKKVRSRMAEGLDVFLRSRQLVTQNKTHDMNRVIKAVFGQDRRRVSAYALALRVALVSGPGGNPIPASDLAGWIREKNGVEEIRHVAKPGGLSTVERAEKAKAAVMDVPLMSFKADTKVLPFDTNDVDKLRVLIVTYRPSGEVEINTIIKSDAVVKAALAAHYADKKGEFKEAAVVQEMKTNAVESVLSGAI